MTETEISSIYTTSDSGCTCSACGKWVNFGENHVCDSITYTYFPCCACMAQVNNLLRKIDELLAKLEAKQP